MEALLEAKADYYEFLLLGVIDGFTSGFNEDCRSGLAETVRNGFSVLDTYQIWLPQNTAKFNIANVALTEASNIVYAYCDMSALFANLSQYTDISNPDQFVVLGFRIAGALVNTVGELTDCVSVGKAKNDGYMVGSCSAVLASTLLDV